MLRKTTTRNCLWCNKRFSPAISEVKRGNGKFCSLSCVCHHRNKYYLTRPIKTELRICNFCHKKFIHRPYKGLGKFCSLICLHKSQTGKQPGHLSQHIRRKFKELAFKTYGEKCEVCDYSLCIDVHHLISRSEGGKEEISNLSVLCPNHHREIHIGILTAEDIRNIRKEKLVEMAEGDSASKINTLKTSTSIVNL